MDSDSDSNDGVGEKVKFEKRKSTDVKENKKNALYARFVNVSAKEGQVNSEFGFEVYRYNNNLHLCLY